MDNKFNNGLTVEENKILIDAGYIQLKKTEKGGIVGLYQYMFSLGLKNHIEVSCVFDHYNARYCYPIETPEMIDIAFDAFRSWDGVSDPLSGWVKYKGVDGERLPPEIENIQN